jgi:signal transduction histidine kinase
MSPVRLKAADLPSVRLSRITLPVALAAALLVALGAPLAWFFMSLDSARSEVLSLAGRGASQVKRLAEESPDLWAYNTPKIAEYLRLSAGEHPFSIRVVDRRGRVVYSHDAESNPQIWEQVRVAHGGREQAVVVAGLPVGDLVLQGLGLLAAFSLAGFLLGAVLGVLPLTVLRRSEIRLVDAVDRLQQARSDLTELNAQLERRVDEKTARLQEAHARLQEQQERLRKLAAATFAGQEEERQIIAADLHDSVGQLLTAVRINIESASALAAAMDSGTLPDSGAGPDSRAQPGTGMRLARVLSDTARLVDETTEHIRQVIRVLGTPLLDQGGLEPALRALVANFAHASCRVELRRIPGAHLVIPPAVQSCAFRVVQEALTNAMRHANPVCVTIDLSERAGALVVEVADDGVGQAGGARPGMGLRSMKDRVALLGGEVDIGSGVAGRGTLVRAVLPLGVAPEAGSSDGSGDLNMHATIGKEGPR